ncbi:hypothetical protein [Sulfobacillus thermotolerans]|uniref:hypothetical protein n=1 Tax=Sulfobacillus thermotolerans TaxID=338644 RepID=UPI0033695328
MRAADSSLMPTFIRKQRTLGMVFGGALLTLSLSACGQTAPSATHQPSTITIKSSGMTSLWSYRPHPLVALKPFNVNVSLRTANGKPVTNAHIVFIDTHIPLLVEADLLLYLMGVIAGSSWYIILDRQSWLGLLVTPAMALMIIGSVLAGHGWC